MIDSIVTHSVQVSAMDSPAQGSAAIIIVNWLYNGINMENLQFPENDGNIMKELFDRANYTKVEK